MEREVLVLILVQLLAVLAAPGPEGAAPAAVPEHRAAEDAADGDFTGRGPSFGAGSFLDFSRGYQRLGKKMILPLLVGILLKVASFVPLILGKLSLLALASIVASKLALLISAIVGTKKLYTSHAVPYSYGGGGHGDWESAASNMYAELAQPGAAAYGAYGAHPAAAAMQAMPHHRRVAAATGHQQGAQGALASLAAQFGRALDLDSLENKQGRSLASTTAGSAGRESSPSAIPTTTSSPTTSTPISSHKSARRRRTAVRA